MLDVSDPTILISTGPDMSWPTVSLCSSFSLTGEAGVEDFVCVPQFISPEGHDIFIDDFEMWWEMDFEKFKMN